MSSEVDPREGAMSFFSENVDRWGAAEWFDRLAKAIGAQNKAVADGDDVGFETYRLIASSSAMRLVSDYEAEVRRALSASPSIGRVKPLEWEPTGSYPFVAISSYYYIGHQSGDGRYWVHHRIFGDLREGDGTIEHHLTEDAAKAAAQEDHERKILWQIVGSSDPDVAPPNVEHLRPLADREKSATLVYHEEPAGDTQGAGGRVKEAAETEHVERDVLSGDTQGALPAGAGTDLAAAFEHQVTQQTNAYEFKTGAKPGTWMFRCSDWIDITAILAALVSPPDNGEPGNG